MRHALKPIIAGWVLAGACGFARPALGGETPAKPAGTIPDASVEGGDSCPPGWTTNAPRDEIRPSFSYEPKGGPTSTGSLVIRHDRRNGLDGWFQKQFAVTGGELYRFHAVRRTEGVAVPRRRALVRVVWQDDAGKMVPPAVPTGRGHDERPIWLAEPEHPADGATDPQGWTTVGGVYRAPARATRAVVELHLQWAPGGRVEWGDVELAKATPPPPRKVRLAAVHYEPTGKSPRENLLLARARACENHVYVVSSTYMDVKDDWMISAVFDREGTPIARAGEWGTVAVAEVDLSQPTVGPYNLGDFRSMVPRHRPVAVPE